MNHGLQEVTKMLIDRHKNLKCLSVLGVNDMSMGFQKLIF